MSTNFTSDFREENAARFRSGWDRGAANCWLWRGPFSKGYGRMSWRGPDGRRGPLLAHRAAWVLYRGDPGALCVLHHCDVPPCVNPDHLFLGTQADNVRDMDQKGRRVAATRVVMIGAGRSDSKLTPDAVREIRASDARGCDLADRFGVTRTLITGVRKRRCWAWVPDDPEEDDAVIRRYLEAVNSQYVA